MLFNLSAIDSTNRFMYSVPDFNIAIFAAENPKSDEDDGLVYVSNNGTCNSVIRSSTHTTQLRNTVALSYITSRVKRYILGCEPLGAFAAVGMMGSEKMINLLKRINFYYF